jgi:hypothetical protein
MADEKPLNPFEKRRRLGDRAAELGTTLDYQDTRDYPRFTTQLEKFSQMVAPNDRLNKHEELTGDEITEMRALMPDKGEAPHNEGPVLIRAQGEIDEQEEAPRPEPWPECGEYADDYTGTRDCPDGFMLCCPQGHRWRAAQ